jgi:predicted small secreted protein
MPLNSINKHFKETFPMIRTSIVSRLASPKGMAAFFLAVTALVLPACNGYEGEGVGEEGVGEEEVYDEEGVGEEGVGEEGIGEEGIGEEGIGEGEEGIGDE